VYNKIKEKDRKKRTRKKRQKREKNRALKEVHIET
jgi:hypothetical protein